MTEFAFSATANMHCIELGDIFVSGRLGLIMMGPFRRGVNSGGRKKAMPSAE